MQTAVFFLLALTHPWFLSFTTPVTVDKASAPAHQDPAKTAQASPQKPPPPPARSGEPLAGAGARLIGAQLQWGGPQGQERWGRSLSVQGFGLFTGRRMSMRFQDRLQIGGQGGAFHLRLQIQAALGGFWSLFKHHGFAHGLVARLGVALDGSRQAHHRTRWLRVPELQLGWAGRSGPFQYDLVALASPYVYHRVRKPHHWIATQHSASFGGAAALVYRRLRVNLRGDWTRLGAAWRPRIQADLCVHLWTRPAKNAPNNAKIRALRTWVGPYEQRYRAGLCASALASHITGARGSSQTRHIALSLMLGNISFLDPTR